MHESTAREYSQQCGCMIKLRRILCLQVLNFIIKLTVKTLDPDDNRFLKSTALVKNWDSAFEDDLHVGAFSWSTKNTFAILLDVTAQTSMCVKLVFLKLVFRMFIIFEGPTFMQLHSSVVYNFTFVDYGACYVDTLLRAYSNNSKRKLCRHEDDFACKRLIFDLIIYMSNQHENDP